MKMPFMYGKHETQWHEKVLYLLSWKDPLHENKKNPLNVVMKGSFTGGYENMLTENGLYMMSFWLPAEGIWTKRTSRCCLFL